MLYEYSTDFNDYLSHNAESALYMLKLVLKILIQLQNHVLMFGSL